MAAQERHEPTSIRGSAQIPVPYTQVHQALRRTLELVQDIVMIALMMLLTVITLQALWRLLQMAVWEHAQSAVLLSQIVYVLILTELYRTFIFYLREHRVSVALMLEVAIVSILQGLILSGVHGYDWQSTLSTCLLLLVLGGLLTLDRWQQRMSDQSSHSSVH
jgi:uncharacterized membrane protein (DUF373 family)